MTSVQVLRTAAVAILAAGLLGRMNSFVPLQWPTVLVCGFLSILVPPAWSGFSRRIYGLQVGIVAGGALFAAGAVNHCVVAGKPAGRLHASLRLI